MKNDPYAEFRRHGSRGGEEAAKRMTDSQRRKRAKAAAKASAAARRLKAKTKNV